MGNHNEMVHVPDSVYFQTVQDMNIGGHVLL